MRMSHRHQAPRVRGVQARGKAQARDRDTQRRHRAHGQRLEPLAVRLHVRRRPLPWPHVPRVPQPQPLQHSAPRLHHEAAIEPMPKQCSGRRHGGHAGQLEPPESTVRRAGRWVWAQQGAGLAAAGCHSSRGLPTSNMAISRLPVCIIMYLCVQTCEQQLRTAVANVEHGNERLRAELSTLQREHGSGQE